MQHQVIGARAGKSDEELAQVGHVCRHDADQTGTRHVTISDGTHQRGANKRVGEIVHGHTMPHYLAGRPEQP